MRAAAARNRGTALARRECAGRRGSGLALPTGPVLPGPPFGETVGDVRVPGGAGVRGAKSRDGPGGRVSARRQSGGLGGAAAYVLPLARLSRPFRAARVRWSWG